MLLKIQLILHSLLIVDANKQQHTNGPIVIKLNTDKIIDALRSERSLTYIKQLVDVFAAKAAEHIVDQIKDSERERTYEYDRKPQKKVQKAEDRSKDNVLNESEALVLIEEPPPDGDNLTLQSFELSDEKPLIEKKSFPVIGLAKVNGRYFYRRYYLGLQQPRNL